MQSSNLQKGAFMILVLYIGCATNPTYEYKAIYPTCYWGNNDGSPITEYMEEEKVLFWNCQETFSVLGREGWELVLKDHSTFIFKRPAQ